MSIKAGYWLAKEANRYSVENVPEFFSHLFYAFAEVDDTNNQLKISDVEEQNITDFSLEFGKGNSAKKGILSIGGLKSDSSSSRAISNIARTRASRNMFIASTINIARKCNLDGLELSWQFPKTPQDMENMGQLFKEWRARIKAANLNLILAATVYFQAEIPRENEAIKYPVKEINENLDFINLVLYDYHPATVAHAQVEVGATYSRSTDGGISSWIKAGVPANKLVMGIPLYGHKWTLENPDDNGIGAPVTQFSGTIAYKDISLRNRAKYDDKTKSEYVADGYDWYGFDGERSMKAKVQYAKSKGLGGYYLYHLGQDDGDHTLSRAAAEA